MASSVRRGIGSTDEHALRVIRSYRHWTGRSLIGEVEPRRAAESLYLAPLYILSHGMEADPVLNFGSKQALDLWEMDWETFTRTPSRLTAEKVERDTREAFMRAVREQGFVSDYSGVRISASGRRFVIEQATVWNVLDETGVRCGQAAAFERYRRLD
ncbi:MEKHLA domain-containing protein [Paenibacillus sp. UNCCL117]|uniref:MEKHLA domain-containing protein n=1 Tax=unclassified Paenibacillus TaxID=185978 RepID=UPI0008828804|nr:MULTISPECIES: MEKHLA domain-containing protein [unclassified Paenibacillus]SDD63511.1 MEKHLA domain-containing protein [Paenibacillus sp. cl123]SFW58506.1 MEKHLA domain-containing protein [Paenibacillus sp. UNCCL117]